MDGGRATYHVLSYCMQFLISMSNIVLSHPTFPAGFVVLMRVCYNIRQYIFHLDNSFGLAHVMADKDKLKFHSCSILNHLTKMLVCNSTTYM